MPFVSEALKSALYKANVPSATADEIIKVNKQSQIDGLRTSEAILALLALIALPFTRGIPTVQPGAQTQAHTSQGIEKTLASRNENATAASDALDKTLPTSASSTSTTTMRLRRRQRPCPSRHRQGRSSHQRLDSNHPIGMTASRPRPATVPSL